MADLTTKRRDALPASKFGEPKERKYPMPDRSHAANAKARASQQEAKGNISESTKAKIDAKADRVLGEKSERNANRTADRAVARISKPSPVK